MLKNALTQVAGEEKPVRVFSSQGSKKSQLGNADVLCFINYDMVEYQLFLLVYSPQVNRSNTSAIVTNFCSLNPDLTRSKIGHNALPLGPGQPAVTADPGYVTIIFPTSQLPSVYHSLPL